MSIKLATVTKTLFITYVLNKIPNIFGSIQSSYIATSQNIGTLFSYVSQPKTVIAYVVTEFLPISNIPINIIFLAYDDGSIMAFDDGSYIGIVEI